MTGSVITNEGKKIILDRAYKSSPTYSIPSKFKVGISNGDPLVTDTALDIPVPIDNGTVNDGGDNALTGSSGGDNSGDNSVTYKPGAGVTDNVAQDLIANNTNATKIWTIADLSANGTNIVGTLPFGLWLYVKDSTTLAKFKSAGTCLEVKLGSAVGDYYSKTWEASDLATGWNWITSNLVAVEDLTETGTVAGNIDTFIIEVTTNNATDTFAAGDVVYDLLRTWLAANLLGSMDSGYPSINESTLKVTMRCTLTSVKANGFPLDAIGLQNTDGTPKVSDIDVHTDESKSDTDEFVYEIINAG